MVRRTQRINRQNYRAYWASMERIFGNKHPEIDSYGGENNPDCQKSGDVDSLTHGKTPGHQQSPKAPGNPRAS